MRVDSVHSEAYKVLGGISRVTLDAEQGVEDGNTEIMPGECTSKKEKELKLSPLPTFKSSFEALNAIGSNCAAESNITTQKHKPLDTDQHGEPTTIEMTATDRPNLFFEISAAIADLHCNIVEAHAWSHNARLDCVAYINDPSSDTHIDGHRLAAIKHHLDTILYASITPENTCLQSSQHKDVKSTGLIADGSDQGTMTTVERRLHQLLLSVQDFDVPPTRTECPPGNISLGMNSGGDDQEA